MRIYVISHVHRAYNYVGHFGFSGYIWLDTKICVKIYIIRNVVHLLSRRCFGYRPISKVYHLNHAYHLRIIACMRHLEKSNIVLTPSVLPGLMDLFIFRIQSRDAKECPSGHKTTQRRLPGDVEVPIYSRNTMSTTMKSSIRLMLSTEGVMASIVMEVITEPIRPSILFWILK